MLTPPVDRLISLTRRGDADLAEAALLVEATFNPAVDPDVALLRVDALSDQVKTELAVDTLEEKACAIAAILTTSHDFSGKNPAGHTQPDAAWLTSVLDTRDGLPILLTIVYVAVARRLGVPAYAIHLPGHVVAGVSAVNGPPLVIDMFFGGEELNEDGIRRRVRERGGANANFHRALLRPRSSADVTRRILHNLTRAFTLAHQPFEALCTVEVKLALANASPQDHKLHGDLLVACGQFDQAADAYERFLTRGNPSARINTQVRQQVIAARARLN
ncbi:MAG: transglutaminase-like domain-containing protein [Nitriliruptoraceae bacterium]